MLISQSDVPLAPPPVSELAVRSALREAQYGRAIELTQQWVVANGVAAVPAELVPLVLGAYHASHRFDDGADFVERLADHGALTGPVAKVGATLFSEAGRLRGWGALLDRTLGDGNDPTLLLERARAHFSLQEYAAAIATCDRIPRDTSNVGVAEPYLRGAAHAGLAQWDLAEQSLRLCLERQPRHYRAMLELGRVQLRRKNIDGAIETLRRCISGRPRDRAAILLNLGQALQRAGQGEESKFVLRAFKSANAHEEKRKDLEQAVRINPSRVDVYVELAEFLVDDPAERRAAQAAIARGLELAPNSDRLLIAKGRFLRPVDISAAKDAFVAALAANVRAHDARLELAEITLSANGLQLADRFLSRCREHVDASRWNLAFTELEARRGRGYGSAVDYARRAVDADPTNLEAVLAWVDLGMAFQEVEATTKQLAVWSAADPTNPRFLIAHAVLEMERDRFQAAADLLALAMTVDPYFPPTHHFSAQLLRRQDNKTEAKVAEARATYLARVLGQ